MHGPNDMVTTLRGPAGRTAVSSQDTTLFAELKMPSELPDSYEEEADLNADPRLWLQVRDTILE